MTHGASRFDGLHVALTGAGSGIGRAIAQRLAAEGASLSLVARNQARLASTAAEIERAGHPRPRVFAADIRDHAAVARAFGELSEQGGPLHALVANSGIGGPNSAGSSDRFDELVATNLTGSYHCLREAEARLAPGPGTRHLIVISSILARLGVGGYTGYCASKAGLCGLVRALAAELAPRNVQVNAVLPGWVDTDMAREGLEGMARAMDSSVEEARRVALSSVPLGRMARPEDVAGLVAWLLSADARGVTGASLDINNGAWMS